MRAILIDSENFTVTETDYDNDIETIYRLLKAQPFDSIRIDDHDTLYIDDEGLLREDQQHWFTIPWFNQPMAGNGLIIGIGREGDSIACRMTLETARAAVRFCLRRAGRLYMDITTVPEPYMELVTFGPSGITRKNLLKKEIGDTPTRNEPTDKPAKER